MGCACSGLRHGVQRGGFQTVPPLAYILVYSMEASAWFCSGVHHGVWCSSFSLVLLWVHHGVWRGGFSLVLLWIIMVYKAAVCRELLHVECRCQDRRTPPCLSKQTAAVCQDTRSHKLINGLSMPISNTCEHITSHRNASHVGFIHAPDVTPTLGLSRDTTRLSCGLACQPLTQSPPRKIIF